MSGYHYEQGEWVDGFGKTWPVVRFYVPDHDDEWLMCEVLQDGSLDRLWSRGPVHLRSGPIYANVDAAAAVVEAVHRDWLTRDHDAWEQAIGVLKPEGGDA